MEAVTGAGKTRIGLVAIRDELVAGGKATVIVPTLELLHQWRLNLGEHLPEARIDWLGDGHRGSHGNCDVLVTTVHSASKHHVAPLSGRSIIVADEVHRFAAETFRLALEEEFTSRLGLSATWQRADGLHEEVLVPYFDRVVFSLDYARARQEDAICPFRIALVSVPLDANERDAYESASEKLSRYRRRLVNAFGAPEEPLAEFMKWVNEAKNGHIPGAERIAGFYLSAMNERRNILDECRAKLDCSKALTQAVSRSNKTIGFTMTVPGADKLAAAWSSAGISVEPFHSQLAKDDRADIFSKFSKGKLQAIVAPKVLDEGVDVPDADLAIIFATSRSRIQLIQRIGRVLRRKADDRDARIALLYVAATTEDPNEGAHDEVLDDLEEAAEETGYFCFPDQIDEIVSFLSPDSHSSPQVYRARNR